MLKHRALIAITVSASLATALAALAAGTGPAAAQPGTRPGTTRDRGSAGSTPWSALNYAPASRTVHPVAVHSSTGTVTHPRNVLDGKVTRLTGQHAAVTLDFGKEVGGLVSLHFAGSSDAAQRVGLAFTESSLYIGENSDSSNGGANGTDGAIYADVDGAGTYSMPKEKLRGGFRYLTVFLDTDGTVDLDNVTLDFTAAPQMKNLRAYPNYFYSSDKLLNRIWYAGAYTAQMGTIAPDTGRVWGPPASGWDNSATVGVGKSVLVDGAKRDRTVWPGDLGVAVPTSYVSTDDMVSVRNALDTLYDKQQVTGELPFAGPEVNFYGSDTYHMWTLVGTANYYTYTDDKAWLRKHFSQYRAGVRFILDKVDAQGLLSVTGTNDWARSGQGGENIAANAILYRVLRTGAALAKAEHRPDLARDWNAKATTLKNAANRLLWDADAGLYRDNPTSTVHPQDGNSLAVWYGLASGAAKQRSISNGLTGNWNKFGATTPEKGGNIGTFPGSMEVQAHFVANQDETGLELIRREWGYMLDSPVGTGSTFWEGYKADGSFDYSGTYMSLAHGWATGPTSALTFYVLGTEPDGADGAFHYLPHPGDLRYAEGRIQLPQGRLDASWTRTGSAGAITERLTSPRGSLGEVGVPTSGSRISVTLDGRPVWDGDKAVGKDNHQAHLSDGYVVLSGVTAGNHVLRGKPAGGSR
jgi:hypothetical protein